MYYVINIDFIRSPLSEVLPSAKIQPYPSLYCSELLSTAN